MYEPNSGKRTIKLTKKQPYIYHVNDTQTVKNSVKTYEKDDSLSTNRLSTNRLIEMTKSIGTDREIETKNQWTLGDLHDHLNLNESVGTSSLIISPNNINDPNKINNNIKHYSN